MCKQNFQYTAEQKRMIEHNTLIIEDNIFFGYKNGYTEEEIEEYEQEAYQQLREFKSYLRAGNTKADYDWKTDLYVIPGGQS